MKADRSSSRGWAAQIVALVVAAVSLIGACSAVSPERDGSPETPMTPVLSSMATHATSATSATVSWTAPDTNLVVSGYELRWRLDSDSASDSTWDSAEVASSETTYRIGGLDPNTTYRVQVRAVYANDVGDWSGPLRVTTEMTPTEGPTEGPTVVTTETVTTTSVTVGWTPPTTTLEVLRFELRWRPSTENDWPDDVVSISSTESSHTIPDLDPDTEYAVQVRAVFADGVGEWSQPLIARTDAAGSTSQPTQPTIVAPTLVAGAVGQTSVTVTWTLPTTTLEVLRFELRWRLSADDWPDDVVSISSAESSHTITGLDLDTEYAVQVRAVFASGEGPWSPSVTPRTKSDRQIVTIEAVQPSYGEHVDQIWFLLIRDDGSGTLTVNFSFTETGADRLITRSGDGHFSREALRMTITARIKSDDSTMQPDSVITATIQPDTDYTVGTPSSASLTVTDND